MLLDKVCGTLAYLTLKIYLSMDTPHMWMHRKSHTHTHTLSLSLYSTVQSAMLLRISLPHNSILAISSYLHVPTNLTRTKHVADTTHHLNENRVRWQESAVWLFGVKEAEGYGHGQGLHGRSGIRTMQAAQQLGNGLVAARQRGGWEANVWEWSATA